MRAVRRALALGAALTALCLTLSGCLYAAIPEPIPRESPAPDTTGVSAELLPFYGQTLDWEPCNGRFECTTVTAPLDWENPGAATIELALIRHLATVGEPIGSLFTNPGGPGASGVDFVSGSLNFAVGYALQREYDVVGFDPRGVGQSTAVTCLDDEAMDAYLFDIPTAERGTPEWTTELEDRSREFAEACDANSDGILPYISTANAARDLDLLRAVVGDPALDYLGFSWGTFLGATYAKLFPERVGRLVLDGALDPAAQDIGITQAIGFESALRAYMGWCLTQRDCPFRGTVDDAMTDLSRLLESVDRRPLPGLDGRRLGADTLMTAIITPLYSRANWPVLTGLLADALQGNAENALSVADMYYARVNGEYTDNSTEAFRAYNCMDYPATTPEEDAAAEALLAEKAPTIAPFWSGPDPCAQWPYPPTGVREPITAEGAPPIVVIGTTNDPATPYAWSVALADQLSSGVLITREGEGHTGYNKGSACVDDAVEAYLLDGDVPPDGLECR